MLSRRQAVLGLILIALGAGGYALWRGKETAPLIGVVRTTQIRVAPEVGGQLVTINVQKGDYVRAGDVVAKLSAIELSAAVVQARAGLDAAPDHRDNVYAGVRAEEVASLASAIGKAKSRLDYAQSELARKAQLVPSNAASQQELDQAQNDFETARADVADAQASHAAAVAGPTHEERAIADAQVEAAAAAPAGREGRLEQNPLGGPSDGIVTVIVAEVGENVTAGQPVLAIAATDKQWLSFNARQDMLHGLTVGDKVEVVRAAADPSP